MKKFQSSIVCLILLVSVASAFACFITNCPPGGKRSGTKPPSPRKCESCGPHGSGRCYGPSICCSHEFGCLIGTPAAFPCTLETRFTTPCQNPGNTCSGNGNLLLNGQCAGDGICCSSDTCTLDEKCQDRSSVIESPESIGGSLVVNHGFSPRVVAAPNGRRNKLKHQPFFVQLTNNDRLLDSDLVADIFKHQGSNSNVRSEISDTFLEDPLPAPPEAREFK